MASEGLLSDCMDAAMSLARDLHVPLHSSISQLHSSQGNCLALTRMAILTVVEEGRFSTEGAALWCSGDLGHVPGSATDSLCDHGRFPLLFSATPSPAT